MHKKSKRDEALVLAYNRIIRENKDASKLFTCRLMDLVINSPAPSFFLDEFTIARYINLTERASSETLTISAICKRICMRLT